MVWRSREREHKRTGQYSGIPDAPRIVSLTPPTDPNEVRGSPAKARRPTILVFIAGTRVIQLDLRTGKLSAEAQDVGVLTGRPARYADMDGDGVVDIVLCEKRPDKTRDAVSGKVAKIPQVRIAVWSLAENELLWQRDFTAHWPRRWNNMSPPREWPLVSDLGW